MPDEYVAGVDADPKLHPNLARKSVVLSCELGLYFKCARQGVDGTGEFSQHAVARGVRNPALMPGDRLIENASAGGQPGNSAALIGLQEDRRNFTRAESGGPGQ